MIITKLNLKNVKSFKDFVDFELNEDFNIIIGPNGGGKSNLLDIVTVVIKEYFIKSYTVDEGNDNTGFFKNINPQHSFNANQELDKYLDDTTESKIEITFKITENDLSNIKNIQDNVDALELESKNYRNAPNYFAQIKSWQLNNLSVGLELTYSIENNQIKVPTENSHKVFLNYLNYFGYILILVRNIDLLEVHPNYLYFSPYRGASLQDLQGNLSSSNYYSVLHTVSSATSKRIISLINLSTLYFAEKMRKYENEASNTGYYSLWENDTEVILISKYLDKLGYSWNLKLVDRNKNIYEIILKKDNREFLLNQASSGEKEIINFLFGIFAFNLQSGIILVDEPELHLHPKWQSLLLELFIELAHKTKNQFLISTHSASFITEYSINNLIRIYKDDNDVSKKVLLKDNIALPLKDILHIINKTNNEKIFFADVVILVEGITDRLVFDKIISEIKSNGNLKKVIEIIEIKGKSNYIKFKILLDSFNILSYFIADLDYINEIGNEEINKLFITNQTKIDRDVIKNPKSRDGDSIIAELESAITKNNLETLSKLLLYIKSFRKKIKPNLNSNDRTILETFVSSKKAENIYILEKGDIEDYFPLGFKTKNIDSVLDLLKDENFIKWKKDKDNPNEPLFEIAKDIVHRSNALFSSSA